ncbi:MAG TPA: PIN domain-containing protein [Ignavibacteria bacterium]|nr:PIN domain-containing protein [Ignavibacteria bacterium]
MRVFVDTSAFLAVLDAGDLNHSKAAQSWEKLILSEEPLICHNYILVETLALIQSRFGMKAVRVFNDDVVPLISIEWIDEVIHKAATSALIAASKRKLSFVDCVSFEVMRQLGVEVIFAFDSHFAKQGFRCIP